MPSTPDEPDVNIYHVRSGGPMVWAQWRRFLRAHGAWETCCSVADRWCGRHVERTSWYQAFRTWLDTQGWYSLAWEVLHIRDPLGHFGLFDRAMARTQFQPVDRLYFEGLTGFLRRLIHGESIPADCENADIVFGNGPANIWRFSAGHFPSPRASHFPFTKEDAVGPLTIGCVRCRRHFSEADNAALTAMLALAGVAGDVDVERRG